MAEKAVQYPFPRRIFSRIISIQAFLILSALIGSGLAGRYFFKKQIVAQSERQLKATLVALSRSLPTSPENWCGSMAHGAEFRLTLIRQDGQVICDSRHDPSSMDNHGTRPEVLEARKTGFGGSVRFSATLHENLLYAALWLPERNLTVRSAIPLAEVSRALSIFDTSFTLFLTLMALVLITFALWSGRKLISPLTRLLAKVQGVLEPDRTDSGGPPAKRTYGEWRELESSIDTIQKDLRSQLEALVLERNQQATLMGAISDAILAVDREGAPLFYNSRFAVLFGAPDLRARSRLAAIFADPAILEAFEAAIRQGEPGSVKAFPIDLKSERRFLSLSVSPLRSGSADHLYGAIGIFHDVTELKRAEQMRIDFVANVSHELRTPLTAIKGYADTLQLDLESGKAPERGFIEVIVRNTERLMNLISDLLDLSSLESTDVLNKSQIGTADITAKVLRQLQGAFDVKKQKVTVEANAPTVYADSRRLEQVLVNLLDNASKYTPVGGKIRVSWSSHPKGEVMLKVSDTGPGIAPEHHPRLFERFYRVDKARSREQGGTGLGLAIVKHILQRHDGTVWVESAPGRGSTFICKFPKP